MRTRIYTMALAALALTLGALPLLPAHAGPGAPAGDPGETILRLPGNRIFSTGYNTGGVLSYSSPAGGWTLKAENTPLSGFKIFENDFGNLTLQVTPDEKLLLLTGLQEVEVREISTGARRLTASIGSAQGEVSGRAVSPDNTRLLITGFVPLAGDSRQHRVRVFDLRSGALLQESSPSDYVSHPKWTTNTRVEIEMPNSAAFDAKGQVIPGIEEHLLQSLDVPLAPARFTPAKATLAGATPDTPAPSARKSTTRRKRHTATRRTVRKRRGSKQH